MSVWAFVLAAASGVSAWTPMDRPAASPTPVVTESRLATPVSSPSRDADTIFSPTRGTIRVHASKGRYYAWTIHEPDEYSSDEYLVGGYVHARQVGVHAGLEWGAEAGRSRGPSFVAEGAYVSHRWRCASDEPCEREEAFEWSGAVLRAGYHASLGGAEFGILAASQFVATTEMRGMEGSWFLPNVSAWFGPSALFIWEEIFTGPQYVPAVGLGHRGRWAELRVGGNLSEWWVASIEARPRGRTAVSVEASAPSWSGSVGLRRQLRDGLPGFTGSLRVSVALGSGRLVERREKKR